MLRFTYMACLVNCIQIRVTWILCRIQTKIEIGLSICLTTTTEFCKEFIINFLFLYPQNTHFLNCCGESLRFTTAVKKMCFKCKLIWIREANCYNLAYEVLPAANIYFISFLSVVWMGLEGPGSLLWKLTRKKAEEDISMGGIKWDRKTQQRVLTEDCRLGSEYCHCWGYICIYRSVWKLDVARRHKSRVKCKTAHSNTITSRFMPRPLWCWNQLLHNL